MGLESLNPAGLAISGGADLLKSLYGVYQMIHGNSQLNKLQHPDYKPDQNILNNQKLAGSIASEGIPDSAKNFYSNQIDRGLGSGISATLQGGGGLGYINQLFQSSNDAYGSLMAKDAMQKLQNQQLLMGANKDVADENTKAFSWNKAVPYQLEYSKLVNQSNAGAENLFGGAKGIGTNFAGFLGSEDKTTNPTTNTTSNAGSTGDWYSYILKQMQDQKLNLQQPQQFFGAF